MKIRQSDQLGIGKNRMWEICKLALSCLTERSHAVVRLFFFGKRSELSPG